MQAQHRIFLLLMSLMSIFFAGCAHKPRSSSSATNTQIVLKNGDTLRQVARRNNVSVAELLQINNIGSVSQLHAGQKLIIPSKKNNNRRRSANKMPEFDGPKIALAWPVEKPVLFREFSEKSTNINEGMDLGAPKNTVVKAAAPGEVLHVGDTGTNFGQTIIISHEKPYITVYANLEQALVKQGATVKQGDVIGSVGTSGGVESPRVHFELRRNRLPINPIFFLPH